MGSLVSVRSVRSKIALKRCGYPDWSFKQVKRKMENKQVKKSSTKKDNVDQKSKGLVVIPFVESTTEKATRVFRRHGNSTAVQLHTTLRKMLVHPKDKRDPLTTTGCVYKLPCSNCNST